MKNLTGFILSAIVFILASCTDSTPNEQSAPAESYVEVSYDKGATPAPEAAPASEAAPATRNSPPSYQSEDLQMNDVSAIPESQSKTERKVIKEGDITIKVEDLKKAKESLDVLAKNAKAYYSSESYSNNYNSNDLSLTVRIPAENFNSFLSNIESGNYEVLSKNISARDVTAEFYDVSTRLESKKLALQRFREILKQARKVEEILEIEDKIRGIQEEIESREGQLRLMKDEISYSTLVIRLTKEFKYESAKPDSFGERIKEAFVKSWLAFVSFIIGLIRIWVFLVFILIALISIRLWWKKRKARKES